MAKGTKLKVVARDDDVALQKTKTVGGR